MEGEKSPVGVVKIVDVNFSSGKIQRLAIVNNVFCRKGKVGFEEDFSRCSDIGQTFMRIFQIRFEIGICEHPEDFPWALCRLRGGAVGF